MSREPPTLSQYLDIKEKRLAYKRHINALNEIIAHPAAVNTSQPPPCGRIIEYDKHRARNRKLQLEVDAENTRSIMEIHRITHERFMMCQMNRSAPPSRTSHKWTNHLGECEKELSASHTRPQTAIKLLSTHSSSQQKRPKRIISDNGMTVVDDELTATKSTNSNRSRPATSNSKTRSNVILRPNSRSNNTSNINNNNYANSTNKTKSPVIKQAQKKQNTSITDQTPRKKKSNVLKPMSPLPDDNVFATSASDFGSQYETINQEDKKKRTEDVNGINNSISATLESSLGKLSTNKTKKEKDKKKDKKDKDKKDKDQDKKDKDEEWNQTKKKP